MALAPRDVDLTREEVGAWLEEWVTGGHQLRDTKALRTFLKSKLAIKALPDEMVNTAAHDDLKNETSVLEMIVRDLPSYATGS